MTDNAIQPTEMAEGISLSESLPMYVARRWGFQIQWHERDEAVFYSIRDWIAGITDSSPDKARVIWKDFKRTHENAGGGGFTRPPLPCV